MVKMLKEHMKGRSNELSSSPTVAITAGQKS